MDQEIKSNFQAVKPGGLKKFIKIYLLVFAGLVLFTFGLWTGEASTKNTVDGGQVAKGSISQLFAGKDQIDSALFSQVWDLLQQNYFKSSGMADKDLFYGAISGMVDAAKDPYTVFFTPEITSDFTQELNGSFSGIGAEIGKKNDILVIIAPLADSPAEKAGLRAGDKIFAIDGQDSTSLSVDQAVTLIRGKKGTTVKLMILSKDEDKPKDITITRDKIAIPSVVYKLENNIAVVEITNFNSDTNDRFAKVAKQIVKDNPKGIVLDLRNDPGGYLNVAVDIASFWLNKDEVVVKEVFANPADNTEYRASGQNILKDFKTVVLVNEGSASASEILAGALQDYGIAKLVGQKTFGKGSVQQLFDLSDGSSLKVTVAEWLTPKDRAINEKGIEPDVVVEFSTEDFNKDLDPQLDKAKELLN